MPITRTAIVDDDGSRTTGTVLNNAWKQELYDQIDAAGGVQTVLTPRTDTGAVNNWAPALVGNTYIPWNGAADATVSGLAGGVAGQIAIVENITAAKVAYFLHASVLSSSANQFANYALSGATPIGPGGKLAYFHTGTNWRLFFHDQGAWITSTYAAGNFTASGAMTWTVDAGDVTACKWLLRGRTLMVNFAFDNTSVGGTPSTDLKINNGAWGGFTSVGQSSAALAFIADAGATATAFGQVTSTGTILRLLKNAFANWSAATNTTQVYGQIAVEVA